MIHNDTNRMNYYTQKVIKISKNCQEKISICLFRIKRQLLRKHDKILIDSLEIFDENGNRQINGLMQPEI